MPDERDPSTPLASPRGGMPAQIGKYRIVDRIGRGAMGVVYSAHDEVIGRPVALKVLMADLESDPGTRARFHREAQAAAKLLHPNIITIFDAGEDGGRSFIAMQLLEGLPLTAYMKRPEAAPLERKLDLMVQMCEGLAAAHGHGIVHRDLKPSNLFVQSDGLLKILDFGVARLADSSMTAAGTMLGTPDYMSPEQARGAQVDVRSDIFSAGAVFYFILSGRKPFPGSDLPTVLRQLQSEEPAPLGDAIPPELEALVRRAMAKDMDSRPARVEDLLAALVRFRRQYQSETRKLALAARSQFDEVRALATAVADVGTAVGMGEDDVIPPLDDLRQRFAPLSARGWVADAGAFDRGRVFAVLNELATRRDQLTRALHERRGYAAQLQAGEAALAAGDAGAALRQFEAVAAVSPSLRARELAERARPLAREQEAREERAAPHTAAARRAIEGRDWNTAIAECRQALALAPGHELATALLAEAEQGVAREQRRAMLITQRLVERAGRALEQHDFDAAEAALREAEGVSPGSTAVADLRRRLATERAEAESTELLRQLSAEEIRRARSIFRRGRYDEAVQQLRGFLEVEPDAREVEQELERLIKLREHLVTGAVAARRAAAELVGRATALAGSGETAEAVAAAREALRTDPTDGDAAELLDRLLTRQLEERVAREESRALGERNQDVEPLLDAARLVRQRGYLAVALKMIAAAQRIAPERADITLFAEEVRSDLTSEDHDMFELASPPSIAAAPPSAPAESAGAKGTATAAPEPGVLDWAADLLRHGLRRGKSVMARRSGEPT